METFFRCKRRTKLHVSSNVVRPLQRPMVPQWKFAYIREYALPGTKVALMQGAHNPEAMGMERLKMETFFRCKRRTKLYGSSNIAVHCSAL